MSNVTPIAPRTDWSAAARACEYLGPAEVVAVHPNDVEVRFPDGRTAHARLAIAFPYEAAKGDELLVIGGANGHFVIGVLAGHGQTTLAFQGDVDIRAEGGSLKLSSDKAVEVHAPNVSILANRVQEVAGAVVQKFESLRQTVSELLSVRAGQSHQIVDGTTLTQAKSATILTEEKVTINGKEIFLG